MITIEQFTNILRNQPGKLESALIIEMRQTALDLEAIAKNNARTYPRVRTGRLRNSIHAEPLDGNQFGVRLRAGGQNIVGRNGIGPADVNYAAKIEFGDGKIAPRRFLGRAVIRQQQRLPKILNNLVKKSLVGQ